MRLFHDAIEEYLLALRQEGKSRATIRNYGWHLHRLAQWMAAQKVVSLAGVSRLLLRRWGAGLRDDWQPATVKLAVVAVRSFFRWCCAEGWLEDDVGQVLKVPHVPKKVQRTLTPDEVQRLLDSCDDSLSGRRDKALISLLVDSGLRASEVCRLRVEDVDLEAGVLVVRVKGGDERFGFIGVITVRRIRDWLEVRPSGGTALFVNFGVKKVAGQPMTGGGLRQALRRRGQKAGVTGVCPHAFRRSFACISVAAGASSRVVQLAGRWSNIEMVERYTQAMRAREVGQMFRECYSPADWVQGRT